MFDYDIYQKTESKQNLNSKNSKISSPLLDVYENGEKFIISVELPGVEKSGIKIRFQEGELKISALKNFDKDLKVLHSERFFGEIKRKVKFHSDIDTDNIKAEYSNGVLTVFLRKLKKKKEIKIN